MWYKTELMEQILTSESAKRMIDYVSPIYGKSRIGLWLFQIIGLELDDVKEICDDIYDQIFVSRATWSLPYWEKAYEITPLPDQTIEQRRQQIQQRRVKKALNPARFEKILSSLSGVEAKAFYDALTKPQAIKDFYENEELIAITKELADTLRRNKTIDWQKRESARAKMRMLIKKLLKKHKYPPEGMEDAVQTVMTQCELWTDNNDMGEEKVVNFRDKSISYAEANYAPMMVAEGTATYGEKK